MKSAIFRLAVIWFKTKDVLAPTAYRLPLRGAAIRTSRRIG